MDRGCINFERLYAIHTAEGFFITRAKSSARFKRRFPNAVDRASTNIVRLAGNRLKRPRCRAFGAVRHNEVALKTNLLASYVETKTLVSVKANVRSTLCRN
jgi:hypothetical protein